MDYFSLFGLPIHYQIDIQQLSSIFQDLQRKYHPDKYISSSQEEQLTAMKKSIIINQAWQTLRNPLARAEYLLSLHGFDLINEHNTIQDTVFIIEQLNLHEELSNIEYKKDKLQLEIFIKHLKEIINTKNIQMIEQLNDKQWEASADTVCKLRFLKKLLINANKLEEKLLNY